VTHLLTLVRLMPVGFISRLAIALVEITLACALMSTSIIVGHQLQTWRAWYWDPQTTHPWAPTPTPDAVTRACPGADYDQLAFARPIGAQCVWFSPQDDGTHLVVAADATKTDLGVLARQRVTATVKVYSPTSWSDPVVVASGAMASTTSIVVFTWEQRHVVELLRVGGERVDIANDAGGWPRVSVMMPGGMRMYRWTGASFAQYP